VPEMKILGGTYCGFCGIRGTVVVAAPHPIDGDAVICEPCARQAFEALQKNGKKIPRPVSLEKRAREVPSAAEMQRQPPERGGRSARQAAKLPPES
jgi:hypothetical protein